MNKVEYFEKIEADLEQYVQDSIAKVNAKDEKIKTWLKNLSDTEKSQILMGYSRPNKWGLSHVLEFFECRGLTEEDTSQILINLQKCKNPRAFLEKIDGTYGKHSFFNIMSLPEVEARFNDKEYLGSIEKYLKSVWQWWTKFETESSEQDIALARRVVQYYTKLYELLQSHHLLVFGLGVVTPRNFMYKMPYCYEVNVWAIPKSIQIPAELLEDAIDYDFVSKGKIANLVSAFYPEEEDDPY